MAATSRRALIGLAFEVDADDRVAGGACAVRWPIRTNVNRPRDSAQGKTKRVAQLWLIAVGAAGEWPLFLDVFFEHVVEKLAAEKSSAGESAIQGPFYVADAPLTETSGSLPMRDDEPGERLRVKGRVLSADGTPISGAIVDHWQADANGFYSNFHPDPPKGNLRGRFKTNAAGEFEIGTAVPAPYMIPHDGPTGALLKASGWHPWRPAHLHYFVDAPGHDRLTTQLFIPDDPWLGVDCASADKQSLIVTMNKVDSGYDVDYDFVLQPSSSPADQK